MRLFEKISENIKHNELTSSYADSVIMDYECLKVRINKLKEIMSSLFQARRKNQASERQESTERLFQILRYIEDSYDEYLYDLNDLGWLLKRNSEMNLSTKVKSKVINATNSRIEIRKEFETVYRRFRSLAKNFDDVPMKAILSQMREVFDFDSKKQKEEYEYISNTDCPRYYDSTTGKIRYILERHKNFPILK